MLFLLASHLTIGYRNPLVYEQMFSTYNLNYKYWYFSLEYSSYQINSAPITLYYPHGGILPDSSGMNTTLLIKDLGGLIHASIGYRVEDLALEFTYYGNEELSLESFDNATTCDSMRILDKVFGEIEDTIYPGEIRGLDRSIRVRYDMDSLNRLYYFSSTSRGGITSRPYEVKFIKGNWFVKLQYRKVEGGGNIHYDARFFILKPAINVEPLDAGVKWYGLITGIPNVPNPFLFERTYSIESRNHLAISAGWRKGNFHAEAGISAPLTLKGTMHDVLKYITFLSDTASGTVLDTSGWNNLRASVDTNGNIEIEGTGVLYVYYDYSDTTIDTTTTFSYRIPANPILGLRYSSSIGRVSADVFFHYGALNNLVTGISAEYHIKPSFSMSLVSAYSRNTWFQYATAGLNAILYSGKMKLTFGLSSNLTGDIYRAVSGIMGSRMKLRGSISPHFSINFSLHYTD